MIGMKGRYDPIAINSIAACPITLCLKRWFRNLASVQQCSFHPTDSPCWWAQVHGYISSHQVWALLVMEAEKIFQVLLWGHIRDLKRRDKSFRLQTQRLVRAALLLCHGEM